MKFLIPFSLPVNIGTHLAWPHRRTRRRPNAGMFFAVEEVGQPFIKGPIAQEKRFLHPMLRLCPDCLLPICFPRFFPSRACGWAALRCPGGMVACAGDGCLTASCGAVHAERMRVEALRRLEHGGDRESPRLCFVTTTMEPGIFGIARPVLLGRKESPRILTARIWKAFWRMKFGTCAATIIWPRRSIWSWKPSSGFIRLFGGWGRAWWKSANTPATKKFCSRRPPPHVYAESILKTCEFCCESPLACVSGITGADLKKRIVRIMTERMARKLDFGEKGAAHYGRLAGHRNADHVWPGDNWAADYGAIDFGEWTTVQPFEVISIKPSKPGDGIIRLWMSPDKFTTQGQTIKEVIKFAYDIKSDEQFSGGPSWIDSEKYDIEAKEDEATAGKLQKLPMEEHANQIRLMVQAMLADRFKLRVSHETKEIPVYALVVAKGGPKMKEEPPATTPDAIAHPRMFIQFMGPGQLAGTNIGNGLLADALTRQPELGRLV